MARATPTRAHNCRFAYYIFFLCFIPNQSTAVKVQDWDSEALYYQYCTHIVPQTALDTTASSATGYAYQSTQFLNGYFNGGDPLFRRNPPTTAMDESKSITFHPYYGGKTIIDGVYKIQGSLRLRDPSLYSAFGNSTRRLLRLVKFRGPRWPLRRGLMAISLSGYWSESSGKLCMVGKGTVLYTGNSPQLKVALKLNYPNKLSVYNSLITGTLESLDFRNASDYFEPISLLAVSQNLNYQFTLVDEKNKDGCLSGYGRGEYLALNGSDLNICSVFGNGNRVERFELEYDRECIGVNCNPFGGNVKYAPKFMLYYKLQCTEGRKLQMLLGFPNTSHYNNRFPFDPSTTLVAEGVWDEKENQLCAVGCRFLNFTKTLANVSVGDCSTKFSLRFPANFSLRNRNTVVGEIWRNGTMNNSSYVGRIGFRNSKDSLMNKLGYMYEYTEIGSLRKTCPRKNTGRGKGNMFPDEYSRDMRFDMSVRNSKKQVAWGYSTPVYVEDQLYKSWPFKNQMRRESSFQINSGKNSVLNISYKMLFTTPPAFKFGGDMFSSEEVTISAEGMYDKSTGVLCMRGCHHLGSKRQNLVTKDTLDCEIMINLQFSPMNGNRPKSVKGTIESTRGTSDALYFERLELSSNSIYTSQAAASIWRMDLEITMVLVSNTLACLFVVWQLFYVKRQPNVLPFISIVMLIVLTMGHMIPLLLNFKALFVQNQSQQTVFLGSGGWLEVNELIVRLVTMAAFLLQLRLLQLTWSSKQGTGNKKCLWAFERKVFYVTLVLYIGGTLIAWFVYLSMNSHQNPYQPFRLHGKVHKVEFQQYHLQQDSLWKNLKSYTGLVLDGFLLPQILFNVFVNSGEKALSHFFYIGTTTVRLLPHAYDLYRAHSSASTLDLSFIYANHRMDFYSTAWNIIIPCVGLLFAVLIFLQQRFGGRFILPKRLGESSVYEKVPVIGNDNL